MRRIQLKIRKMMQRLKMQRNLNTKWTTLKNQNTKKMMQRSLKASKKKKRRKRKMYH